MADSGTPEVKASDIEVVDQAPTTNNTDADATASVRPARASSSESNKSRRISDAGLLNVQSYLQWRNVNLEIPSTNKNEPPKPVLKNVSGCAMPGELVAIMGPSGAGKTSLLDVLCDRVSNGVTGDVLVNNHPRGRFFKRASAYVQQNDVLLGYLTVREVLQFSARLRLPASMLLDDKNRRVEDVITELGLESCTDTIIGTNFKRGVSGGEKKRASIGVDLLSKPSILFLDEPTSGLDSFLAMSVMQSMKKLAENGRTVIATIHQPRSQIFELVDRLILLSQGEVIYAGPRRDAVNYFAGLGYVCGTYINPADFFLDLVATTTAAQKSSGALTPEQIHGLAQNWADKGDSQAFNASLGKELPALEAAYSERSESEYATSWWMQFTTLLHRGFINLSRDPMITRIQIFNQILFAFLVGGLFYQLPYTVAAVQDRLGLFFFISVQMSFSVFNALSIFHTERQLVNRERDAGMYCTSAYFMAKNLTDLPTQIINPLIYSIIVFFMADIGNTAGKFFSFWGILSLGTSTAMSFAIALSALTPSLEVSQIVTPLIVVVFLLVGGFYRASENIPPVLKYSIEHLSFIGYLYKSITLSQLTKNDVYSCVDTETCRQASYTGAELVEQRGVSDYGLAENLIALGVINFCLRGIGFLAIKHMHRNRR